MQRCNMTRGLLAAALVCGSASTALATTVVQLSDADMARQSELIVTGRCAGLRSEWVGRDLVTVATIEVGESLKGDAAATIQVALPGGIDADRRFPIAVTWPGAPRIAAGEEVLLFLVDDAGLDRPVIAGFAQGKFTIVADENGQKVATQDLGGLTLVDEGRGRAVGRARAIPLSDLEQRVRETLGRDAGRR